MTLPILQAPVHVSENKQRFALPPWLWFWLGVYVITLPAVWTNTIAPALHDLLFGPRGETSIPGTTPLIYLDRLGAVAEMMPYLLIFLGVATIVLPWVRAAKVERRFNLQPFVPNTPALQEIQAFIAIYAPGIQVKANLLRRDQLVFVYPSGYRRTTLAVFAGLVKRWRADKEAAQAILLHEIAHYRRGDALIVGAGSFFETILRWWLPLYLLLVFLPEVITITDQIIQDYQQLVALDQQLSSPLLPPITPPSFWSRVWDQVQLLGPLLVFEFISSLFRTASVFVLAWMGVWCAELYADQFVVEVTGSPDVLLRSLAFFPPQSSWWRRLLFRTSHPPVKLRQWMARHERTRAGFLLLLLLFPLAYYLKLALLVPYGFFGLLMVYQNFTYASGTLVINYDLAGTWKELGVDLLLGLRSLTVVLIAMALLVLLWPLVAWVWERIFAPVPRNRTAMPAPQFTVAGPPAQGRWNMTANSVLGTVLLACLFAGSLLVGPTMASPATSTTGASPGGVSGTPSPGSSTATVVTTTGKHYKVGDQVQIEGKWTATLNKIWETTNQDVPPDPGDTYLVLDLSLTNLQPQDQMVEIFLQIGLIDAAGKFYDVSGVIANIIQPGALLNPSVKAGATNQGILAFEVPLSQHQFSFLFSSQPEFGPLSQGKHVTTWDVSV